MEPRVVLADNAGLFALGGTQTFVLGGRRVAVVDPGPHSENHLARIVAAVGSAVEGVILLTHGHSDHAGGAAALAGLTGFPVAAGAGGWDVRLEDGALIATGAGDLLAIATPGHSRDHFAFFSQEAGDLYVGDLLIGEGDTTWVGEYEGCVSDYLASLDRVEALGAGRIFPAHGPPLLQPSQAVARFRRHRMARIEQVARAARSEAVRLPAVDEPDAEADRNAAASRLVDSIHGATLPPKLRLGAVWSVRAMLEYLGLAPFPPGRAPTEGGALEGG